MARMTHDEKREGRRKKKISKRKAVLGEPQLCPELELAPRERGTQQR